MQNDESTLDVSQTRESGLSFDSPADPRSFSSFSPRVHCMNSSSGLHFKTYCMIFIMVIFGPLGNTLLGKGMKTVGSAASWTPVDLPHILAGILSSKYIWLGVASLLTFFVAYMVILSWADYSYVQPASSVAYLVVALLGYFYLGEKISRLHWLGIAVICLGVLVVGHTPPRTTTVPFTTEAR